MPALARQRCRGVGWRLVRFVSIAVLGAATASCGGESRDTGNDGGVDGYDDARAADQRIWFWAHTVTTLPGDAILIAGGYGSGGASTSSAWLYHPSDRSFEPADPMAVPRAGHTATPLADGRVLVVGGCDFGTPGNTFTTSAELRVFSTEIYDSVTGRWSRAGDLRFGRCDHTATLLPSGKVLVTGGDEADPCGIPELFESSHGSLEDRGTARNPAFRARRGPAEQTALSWSLAGPPTSGLRSRWTCAVSRRLRANPLRSLPRRRPARCPRSSRRSAAVWTASRSTTRRRTAWHLGPPMSSERDGASATVVRDGRVLVAGGFGNVMLATSEIFDPADGRWHPAASMSGARRLHSATLLADGSVLVAGGCSFHCTATAERYDPVRDAWSLTGSMSRAKRNDP